MQFKYLFFFCLFFRIGQADYAYVTNAGSNNVSVVDMTTNTVVATVGVGTYPTDIATTSAGYAYVTNYTSNDVTVLDITANPPVVVGDPISVGLQPISVAISSDGYAYVLNQGSDSVTILNTNISPPPITTTITVGDSPDEIAFGSDGRAYVTNLDSDTVSIIKADRSGLDGSVSVGDSPIGIAINSAGLAYVVNFGSGSISVIDTNLATPAVTGTISIGAALTFEHVAVTTAGKLYITNLAIDGVTVVDPTAVTPIIATIPVGSSPSFIAISSDQMAYVSNGGANTVSVIDTTQTPLTVTSTISVGSSPQGIAFTTPLPATVTGFQTINRFFLQEEVFNTIRWSRPTTNGIPTSYQIYRDAALTQLAGTVSASGPFEWIDHNRRSGESYFYSVVVNFLSGGSATIGNVTIHPL